jgi:predicted transcriptional regulator
MSLTNAMERRRFAYRNCNAGAIPMKSATLPPLRVEPEFREKAQSVLREGESLSSFIEEAVRKQVEIRKSQAEFIARGLASLEEAERTGVYYTTEDVLSSMRQKLEAAKAARASKQK